MPQMSPLSWVTIFLLFSLFFMSILNMLFIYKSNNSMKSVIKKKENSMKW